MDRRKESGIDATEGRSATPGGPSPRVRIRTWPVACILDRQQHRHRPNFRHMNLIDEAPRGRCRCALFPRATHKLHGLNRACRAASCQAISQPLGFTSVSIPRHLPFPSSLKQSAVRAHASCSVLRTDPPEMEYLALASCQSLIQSPYVSPHSPEFPPHFHFLCVFLHLMVAHGNSG